MPAEKPKRRQRSHMTRQDAFNAFAKFCKRVNRIGHTSGGGSFSEFAPEGQLTVEFLVDGDYCDNDDIFEAVRVLGGFKLPAKS